MFKKFSRIKEFALLPKLKRELEVNFYVESLTTAKGKLVFFSNHLAETAVFQEFVARMQTTYDMNLASTINFYQQRFYRLREDVWEIKTLKDYRKCKRRYEFLVSQSVLFNDIYNNLNKK